MNNDDDPDDPDTCSPFVANITIDKDAKVKINKEIKEDIYPVFCVQTSNKTTVSFRLLSFNTGPECESNEDFVCISDIDKETLETMTSDIDDMIELLDKISIAERQAAARAKRKSSTVKGRMYGKNRTYKNRK